MEIENKEIKHQIELLIDASDTFYNQGDLSGAIKKLLDSWELLPVEKEIFDESFLISKYITMLSMEIGDYEQAKVWAYKASKCDPERALNGEKEFLIGQVAFESGDMIDAKKYFKKHNVSSSR